MYFPEIQETSEECWLIRHLTNICCNICHVPYPVNVVCRNPGSEQHRCQTGTAKEETVLCMPVHVQPRRHLRRRRHSNYATWLRWMYYRPNSGVEIIFFPNLYYSCTVFPAGLKQAGRLAYSGMVWVFSSTLWTVWAYIFLQVLSNGAMQWLTDISRAL